MEGLGGGVFWCPRCGTLRSLSVTNLPTDTTPKLVERCRELEATVTASAEAYPAVARDWLRLGVAESINLPKNRPLGG
jgi:hypothetical protein